MVLKYGVSFWCRLSGTVAQGIANPCDLVKVRMIGAGIGGGQVDTEV